MALSLLASSVGLIHLNSVRLTFDIDALQGHFPLLGAVHQSCYLLTCPTEETITSPRFFI